MVEVFGNGAFSVGADTVLFHGNNPLGSGCLQVGQQPSGVRCDYQGSRAPAQEFIATGNMTLDKFFVGLAPYTGGQVELSIENSSRQKISSCQVTTQHLIRHESPGWRYGRTRHFSCSPTQPINLFVWPDLPFCCSRRWVFDGLSLNCLRRDCFWLGQWSNICSDFQGALRGNGTLIDSDGDRVNYADMQYGLRIAGGVGATPPPPPPPLLHLRCRQLHP